jgi:hypothetical protein
VVGTIITIILGGVAAAFAAGWLSKELKLSEFRQAWINELRSDIAAYLGAAHRWLRKRDEPHDLDSNEVLEEKELLRRENEAFVILRRIRLRFNPLSNQYKTEDDEFLDRLANLLNPEWQTQPFALWNALADEVVERARRILKREWEVTKEHTFTRLWKKATSLKTFRRRDI